MNPRAVIMSLPMLRRAWRFLPPPMRGPVLVAGAAVGVWYLVTGRAQDATG